MGNLICGQCKKCVMMTSRGCADDVENDDLENGKCLDFFEIMPIVDVLPLDMSLEEQDLYM